jgi:hypothetical protein
MALQKKGMDAKKIRLKTAYGRDLRSVKIKRTLQSAG